MSGDPFDGLTAPEDVVADLRVTETGDLLWGNRNGWNPISRYQSRRAVMGQVQRYGRSPRVLLETEGEVIDKVIARLRNLNPWTAYVGSRHVPETPVPLLAAAIARDWDAVRAQLAAGADPTSVDPQANTVLHYAAGTGDLDLLRYLVDAGCPLAYRNEAYVDAATIARMWDRDEAATWLTAREVADLQRSDAPRQPVLPIDDIAALIPAAFLAGVILSLLAAVVHANTAVVATILPLAVLIGWAVTAYRTRGTWRIASVSDDDVEIRRGRRRETIRYDDIAAVALGGPWERNGAVPNRLAISRRRNDQSVDGAPRRSAFDGGDLRAAERAGAVVTLRVKNAVYGPLARIVAQLLERGVPVGRLTHRFFHLRAWRLATQVARQFRSARCPSTATSSVVGVSGERVSGEDVPGEGVSDHGVTVPDDVAVIVLYPSGHVELAGPEARAVLVPAGIADAVAAVEDRHRRGQPVTVVGDWTHPWVARVYERLRATGAQVVEERTIAPDLPGGRYPSIGISGALIEHLMYGRRYLALDLIEAGWNPNRTDPWGHAPLTYAVALRDDDLVRALLDAGATPDLADDLGRTPLDCAYVGSPIANALSAATAAAGERSGRSNPSHLR